MPSPWLQKLAKETDKTEKELEKYWKKALKIAGEEFGKKKDDFGPKEYKFAVGVVKNILGENVSILDPTIFLESDLNAKEFLETVASSSFNIGNVKPPKKKKSEDDDMEDEDDDEEEEDDDEEEMEEETSPVEPSVDPYLADIARTSDTIDEDQVAELDRLLDELD